MAWNKRVKYWATRSSTCKTAKLIPSQCSLPRARPRFALLASLAQAAVINHLLACLLPCSQASGEVWYFMFHFQAVLNHSALATHLAWHGSLIICLALAFYLGWLSHHTSVTAMPSLLDVSLFICLGLAPHPVCLTLSHHMSRTAIPPWVTSHSLHLSCTGILSAIHEFKYARQDIGETTKQSRLLTLKIPTQTLSIWNADSLFWSS